MCFAAVVTFLAALGSFSQIALDICLCHAAWVLGLKEFPAIARKRATVEG